MASIADRDKLRTMLPHWIKHNAEHAVQFRRWAGSAPEVEAQIEAAAAQMEAANGALAAAMEKLGGPMADDVHQFEGNR